jgi:sulfate adenylyltransferase subunit 1
MCERRVELGARLAFMNTTRWARAILDEIVSVLDIETFDQHPAEPLELNDLAHVRLRLAAQLLVAPLDVNLSTCAEIVVD